jgi:3'-5' exoribonuclease
MPVRDFTAGQLVDTVLLVRAAEPRRTRGDRAYLKLTLADRSGRLPAILWDAEADSEAAAAAIAGACVAVEGHVGEHPRHGRQLTVTRLRAAAPGEYALDDLLDGPPRAVELMEADLRALLETIQNPWLRTLLDGVFGEGSELWPRFREAPAAKYYHQAYRHGLLEHSLSVAEAVSAIAATFPGVDRDVAVTGALLHDVGKLDAYTSDPQRIDLTDAGRLLGEIALGYYRIRRAIEDQDGFPPELAQAVLHIILSHHGQLEHGSPVVPCTREATLVHMIDNLGGRLGSFDRIEKQLPDGQAWSAFDRALGGGAYFASRQAA